MSDIQINTCVPDGTTPLRKKRKRKRKQPHFVLTPLLNRAKSYGNAAEQRTTPTPHQPAPRVAGASLFSAKPSACARSSLSSTSTADDRPDTKPPPPPPAGTSVPAGCCRATSAPTGIPTKYLAIDCEMVGTGPKGSVSQLARCSIVSYEGDVVYDKFIKPTAPVTNYRTRWSGIRHGDLLRATPFAQARKEILKLLTGKVVIGHAVHNDFKVLSYSHPAALTRDTSRIPLLNQKAGFGPAECASLKRLTKAIFHRDIQTGRRGHSSVEDARASMELYRAVEEEWERKLEASRTNRLTEG